jgi:hypothetical protein
MEYMGNLLAQMLLVFTYMVVSAVILAVGSQIAIKVWRNHNGKS